MPEIKGQPGWHSSDGRDRPTPEFVEFARKRGLRIVELRVTLKITESVMKAVRSGA